MDVKSLIEQALGGAIDRVATEKAPPGLVRAVRHAVLAGGGRIRPRLCLAVAEACAMDRPKLAMASAVAIELMHCASLVHDDLPCFDDAELRRGLPSVHREFGEPLAVLCGDALIVLAFEALAQEATQSPERAGALLGALSRSTGLPSGIAAGQAWESESEIVLVDYQQAKTGAMFVAATSMGALAAGHDREPWAVLGQNLGLAYQVADDIKDVVGNAEELGKPVGQDAALERPSAALQLGVQKAVARLEELVTQAIDSIPPCAGAGNLRHLIRIEAQRLLPRRIARLAA